MNKEEVLNNIKNTNSRDFLLKDINITSLVLRNTYGSAIRYIDLTDDVLFENKALDLSEDKFSKPFKLVKCDSLPNLEGRVMSYKDGILSFHHKKPPYVVRTKVNILKDFSNLPKGMNLGINFYLHSDIENISFETQLSNSGLRDYLFSFKYSLFDKFKYSYNKDTRFTSYKGGNDENDKSIYLITDSMALRKSGDQQLESFNSNKEKITISFFKSLLEELFSDNKTLDKKSRLYNFIEYKETEVVFYKHSYNKGENYFINKNSNNISLINFINGNMYTTGDSYSNFIHNSLNIDLSGYLEVHSNFSSYGGLANNFNYILKEHPFKFNLKELVGFKNDKNELKEIKNIITNNYNLISIKDNNEVTLTKETVLNIIDLDCLNYDRDHSLILGMLISDKKNNILKLKHS